MAVVPSHTLRRLGIVHSIRTEVAAKSTTAALSLLGLYQREIAGARNDRAHSGAVSRPSARAR